jgi:hypothetical protein
MKNEPVIPRRQWFQPQLSEIEVGATRGVVAATKSGTSTDSHNPSQTDLPGSIHWKD